MRTLRKLGVFCSYLITCLYALLILISLSMPNANHGLTLVTCLWMLSFSIWASYQHSGSFPENLMHYGRRIGLFSYMPRLRFIIAILLYLIANKFLWAGQWAFNPFIDPSKNLSSFANTLGDISIYLLSFVIYTFYIFLIPALILPRLRTIGWPLWLAWPIGFITFINETAISIGWKSQSIDVFITPFIFFVLMLLLLIPSDKRSASHQGYSSE